jgi:hypothetical protein
MTVAEPDITPQILITRTLSPAQCEVESLYEFSIITSIDWLAEVWAGSVLERLDPSVFRGLRGLLESAKLDGALDMTFDGNILMALRTAGFRNTQILSMVRRFTEDADSVEANGDLPGGGEEVAIPNSSQNEDGTEKGDGEGPDEVTRLLREVQNQEFDLPRVLRDDVGFWLPILSHVVDLGLRHVKVIAMGLIGDKPNQPYWDDRDMTMYLPIGFLRERFREYQAAEEREE